VRQASGRMLEPGSGPGPPAAIERAWPMSSWASYSPSDTRFTPTSAVAMPLTEPSMVPGTCAKVEEVVDAIGIDPDNMNTPDIPALLLNVIAICWESCRRSGRRTPAACA
jgi:hypothetical protein